MKPVKVAAILVGSVMAMVGAAPAFAADAPSGPGLDGAVDTLGERGLAETVPSDDVGEVADQKLVGRVAGAADGIGATEKAAPLLGGLPLGG
ncbi:hypothetical protein LUX12_11085 [Streptomyces somaliensis]|uniref:hypothetical protein n=1 Tax=Streptomyces somaliensis TaxID=78355 RepID=UPI0020CBC8F1|nr:hypothetical protein [Streptomyces somaliensis]MCP9945196.1 hypothetical protein [Streptomyces somaliensis]MCP9961587.1 hypothetical protein [Streptomyces somaliensis]MCP9974403.1 hypothetical protein [Streptomyces somaliensis]